MPPPEQPNALPFLRSQRLFVLKPDTDPKEAMHPERFRADRPDRDRDGPPVPDETLWEPLPREALEAGEHAGRPLRRVCLTTDAGLGKSYNLRALEYERNDPAGGGLAFRLMVADLRSAADLLSVTLLNELRNAPGNDRVDEKRLLRELERLRAEGKITLLFDGLDQTADRDRLAELAHVLHPAGNWANCPVVVAGRPFAVQQHWETLFAPSLADWDFVQIGELDEEQQRALLGDERFDIIPEDARPILTVPRVLEFASTISTDRLAALRTVSDVYWQATRHMLQVALDKLPGGRPKDGGNHERRYLQLLGALAFSMYADTPPDDQGPRRPNLDRIPAGDRLLDFLYGPIEDGRSVLDRMRAVVPDYTSVQMQDDLGTLCRLNLAVSHGWLEANVLDGNSQPLLWRNASLQEFFSAFWVCRWDKADAALLRDWVPHPNTGHNRGFYWLWRYAAEMPDDVVLDRGKPRAAWVEAMTPLYVPPPDKDGLPIRSTELLYRSWDRPGDPLAGTEPRKRFQAEFQEILAGRHGADKQRLAREMVADVVYDKNGRAVSGGFVRLVGSGLPGDTGTFWMGSAEDDEDAYSDERPRHRVTLSPFGIHRYCVTNVEYELFDPWHKVWRWLDDDLHPWIAQSGPTADDRCPVVNVTWYDAAVFCKWLSGSSGRAYRLPTEAEWEYSCRGGRTSKYHFGDVAADLPRYANFDLKHGGTTPVTQFPANPFGLHDMHGNVWEWCRDWYGDYPPGDATDPTGLVGGSGRVYRGGSWYDSARFCRSAIRVGRSPVIRSRFLGFRLAAVPSGR